MASDGFIQQVKTELNITTDYYDGKLRIAIDEAIERINDFKDEAVDEDTASLADKRAIYIYIKIVIDGREDLREAFADQIMSIRDK